MDDQLRFLLLLARRFDSAGIPYMVTGSLALAVYATPRMTRDIDLVVEVSEAGIDALIELLEPDCYVPHDAVRDAVRGRGMFNAIHTRWVVKADFVVRGDSPYRVEEFQRRRALEVAGEAVWFASPEDLLLSKLHWNRMSQSEQQQRDIRDLLNSVNDLDREYLDRWAIELGVAADLRRLET